MGVEDSFFEDQNSPMPTNSRTQKNLADQTKSTTIKQWQKEDAKNGSTSPIFTTPAPLRSKLPQSIPALSPKKGILKWPPQQSYERQYFQPTAADIITSATTEIKRPSILQRFMMIQALVDPPPPQSTAADDARGLSTQNRPTVEFSERNAVAIYGDTSDECLTEQIERRTSLSLRKYSIDNGIDSNNIEEYSNKKTIVSSIRQMGIFFSEDSEESSDTTSAIHLRHQQQLSSNSTAGGSQADRTPLRPSPLAYSGSTAQLSPIAENGTTIVLSRSDELADESFVQLKMDGKELNDAQMRDSTSPQIYRPLFDSMSTTEDDTHSITSSSGSANIVGKWWFGKNTRFVVHCEKKGCAHKSAGHANLNDYLTPTQRKNREINLLTRQLKQCKMELEEKNKQLIQLREHLKEIETLMQSNETLNENVRLLQRQNEREAEFNAEREQLIQRHEIRVRQLVQETVDARTEMLKKAQLLERLKAEIEIEKVEQSCMTDSITPSDLLQAPSNNERKISAEEKASITSTSKLNEDCTKNKIESEDIEEQNAVATALAASNVIYNTNQQLQIALTQVEAYRNEALIWRTKAAQLEIFLKEVVDENDQATTSDDDVVEPKESVVANGNSVKRRLNIDNEALSDQMTMKDIDGPKKIIKSMSVSSFGSLASLHSLVKQATVKFGVKGCKISASSGALAQGECQNQNCVERYRKVAADNSELREKIEKDKNTIADLKSTIEQLNRKYEKSTAELSSFEKLHEELNKLAEARLVELMAAQMSLSRLQVERTNLKKAISYLESRCQVFQNIILDNDLVVRDDGWYASTIIAAQLCKEPYQKKRHNKRLTSKTNTEDDFKLTDSSTNDEDEDNKICQDVDRVDSENFTRLKNAELRHGFADPDYVVYYSKNVQTSLTSATIDSNNDEFFILKRKFEEVKVEFSMERRKSAEQLADVKENLRLKSDLVEQLTRQMHEIVARERQINEQHQKERDIYRKKMEELGKIAERVPILENEIDIAIRAKSQLQLEFRRKEHNFEEQMERALADVLTQRNETDALWTQKLIVLEEARHKAQAHLEKLQRDLTELKLRHSVEKADLEERLTSSICHITELNNRINCPRRDVECEAKPKVTNKYVACRPSNRTKEAQVVKGDLPDEPELVECRAELVKRTYELKFANNKINRLEFKLLDALNTAHKRRKTPVLRANANHSLLPNAHSVERVTYRRIDNDVRISLRGESTEPLPVDSDTEDIQQKISTYSSFAEDEEISTVSSPPAFHNVIIKSSIKNNELFTQLAKFATEKSDEVKRLRIENKNFATEIHALKERLFEFENEAYERTKDKISHVSYLIPTKLNYDSSCDDIELSVEINNTYKRPEPLVKRKFDCEKRISSLPPEKCTQEKRATRATSLYKANTELNDSKVVMEQTPKYLFETCNKFAMHGNASLSLQKTKPLNNKLNSIITPSKWNFERNALLKKNAYLSDQLLILKQKVEMILEKKSFKKQEKSEADKAKVQKRKDTATNKFDANESLNSLAEICAELDDLLNQNNVRHYSSINAVTSEKYENLANVDREYELRQRLHDAEIELEIYRKEPREIVRVLQRSQSETELARPEDCASSASRELARWKILAGEMFREMNYLRSAINTSESQRLELKTMCAMLRGEIELAKCQNALTKELIQKRQENLQRRRASLNAPKKKDADIIRKNSLVTFGDEIKHDKSHMFNKIPSPLVRVSSANSLIRHDSVHSNSIPSLNNFIEMLENGTTHGVLSDDNKKATALLLLNSRRRRGSVKVDDDDENTRTEEILRKELAIIREAFHAQVGRLRVTNRDLERRVGDLETRLNNENELKKMTENDENLKERINELEICNESLKSECAILRTENEMYEKKIRNIEEERQQMYLLMFRKGQQAAEWLTAEIREDIKLDEMTEDRVMLKFLHDAFYYYLMEKGDPREHLQVIMTMLNFTNAQKAEIYQRRGKSN